MGQSVRRGTAVVAVALILAYVGTMAITPMRDFAPWPTNMLWLGVVSTICGVLLALISLIGEEAVWSIIAASVLAVLIFGGLWSYICWALLGQYISQYISFFNLILSDFVFPYVIKRGALMFIVSVLFELLGAVIALIFLPARYCP